MIPTCISDDRAAAAAVNRKTLGGYLMLPNYRNYWKEAGYTEEMEAVEKALAQKERERVPELVSERWLAEQGFRGDGPIPEIADDVRVEASSRYIQACETIMGVPFEPDLNPPTLRMRQNLETTVHAFRPEKP